MVVPTDIPKTIPEDPTVAMPELPLHEPPEVMSDKVVVFPRHTWATPPMGNGTGFTFIVAIFWHPVLPNEYVTNAVPDDTPVTNPDREPIVATDTGAMLHIPPEAGSVRVVVSPWHTCNVPPIGDGRLCTVTGKFAVQPVGKI